MVNFDHIIYKLGNILDFESMGNKFDETSRSKFIVKLMKNLFSKKKQTNFDALQYIHHYKTERENILYKIRKVLISFHLFIS